MIWVHHDSVHRSRVAQACLILLLCGTSSFWGGSNARSSNGGTIRPAIKSICLQKTNQLALLLEVRGYRGDDKPEGIVAVRRAPRNLEFAFAHRDHGNIWRIDRRRQSGRELLGRLHDALRRRRMATVLAGSLAATEAGGRLREFRLTGVNDITQPEPRPHDRLDRAGSNRRPTYCD